MGFEPTTFAVPKLSVLLKGKPGAAKTHTALSFPGPILYLYADPNLETARQLCKARNDIVAVRIADWKNYHKDIRAVLGDRSSLEVDKVPVKTVVLDTWSFFAGQITKDLQGPQGKMQMQDWGMLLNRQQEALLELVTMTLPMEMPDGSTHPGVNIVVNCHTKENFEEGGALHSIGLAIQGSFSTNMEAYFDYVLLLEARVATTIVNSKAVDTKEYVIHSIPPPKHTCKGGNLPPKITVPAGANPFDELNKTWKI